MSDKSLDEKTPEFGENDFGEGGEFGAENVESYSVENGTETISSNKRIKEMSIDRLSALPDCLLIRILSLLGVKRAAITSVLSKRWQFLWAELPRLEFWESSKEAEKIREFAAMVNRTLFTRKGIRLDIFDVDFTYDECFASDVNIWVEFAVKNKVNEVHLRLNSKEDFYTLPEIMYSNSSLTRLSVQGSIMEPLGTIEWKFLTSLYLREVVLQQHVIEKILSGCPVLCSLDLTQCWGFNCLDVKSQSLHLLTVTDSEDGYNEPLLEISAPYIRYLDISLYPEGRKLQLRNISSLVKADIDFYGYDWDSSSEEVISNTKEFFENIKHVQELDLQCHCFEVVSMLAVNGWYPPQSTRRCLKINTLSADEDNISGIVALLDSSPNLETFVIECYDTSGALDTWGPPARGDLDRDLFHLKTVKIIDFGDPSIGGEPMLTMARILLKRATVLEKMVIVLNAEDTSDFIKIGQILLTYPRSSQKAIILLS